MDNLKEFNSASRSGGKGAKVFIVILVFILLTVAGFYVKLRIDYMNQEEELTVAIEERISLTTQYESLLDDYDELETSNDTLSAKLNSEQEKIKTLISELKNVKAQNRAEITRYKKELKTLRNIMKGFIRQIDSLNTLNIQLTEENQQIKRQFKTAQEEKAQIEEKYEEAADKVELASVIRAINVAIESYNHKGKTTNRARKTKRFGITFVLDENVIAPTGTKKVFIRITDPVDHVLITPDQPMFEFEGEEIAYSAFREIEYDGTATSATVYYEHVYETDLIEGTYKAEIFCDGSNIGSGETYLK